MEWVKEHKFLVILLVVVGLLILGFVAFRKKGGKKPGQKSGGDKKPDGNTAPDDAQKLVPDDEGNLVDAITGLYPKDADGNDIIKKAN